MGYTFHVHVPGRQIVCGASGIHFRHAVAFTRPGAGDKFLRISSISYRHRQQSVNHHPTSQRQGLRADGLPVLWLVVIVKQPLSSLVSVVQTWVGLHRTSDM